MKYISNDYYCAVPIIDDYYSCTYNTYNTCYYPASGIYDTLDEVKEKSVFMNHLPKDIMEASKVFPGYLTDEELQEKQYKGRFWDISKVYISSSFMYYLYILVDNETLVMVDNQGKIKISGRDYLPYSLQGRYYD